ncbi:MAG: heavy metal translocating P-type ATPase metal-binding domain-containing protein [Cyclobacteriaceae bacterium]|nr:heavy metal translocating P-type ATPase metal-binding domain-containing protein [Cyclobacteriaceae bacterium]
MENKVLTSKLLCYHCGETCQEENLQIEDKYFCCLGCKTVYEILNENDLCGYYDIDNNPGISLNNNVSNDKYAYLDNEKINHQLSDFIGDHQQIITLYIPAIHCSSCIWLLENLYRLKKGINQSRVQFSKKQLTLQFDPSIISLRNVVETLVSVGYDPQITLDTRKKEKSKKEGTSLYLKIGVAGFCFGNIMFLSFPEYFGFDGIDVVLKQFFSYISLLLSLPIVFYAASDYFKSAFKGFNQRYVNIDVPIVLGIVTLFLRSAYEILMHSGNGYLDSLAGLLFFLLIGKWFQSKTYQGLSFDRDYNSYFPLAIHRIIDNKLETVPINEIEIGNEIVVKNNELIPSDAILLSDTAFIDYSFVTGESQPIQKFKGDYIYAGGKQKGNRISLKVEKTVSQSYLTQLWNNDAFQKNEESSDTFVNSISKYFTLIILLIAITSAITWFFVDPSKMINAFTAVLIVACPCALALSTPFTMGNALRVFGRLGLYLKNAFVIERMSKINHIVFDKTGTITYNDQSQINYEGQELTIEDKQAIASLTAQSSHPLSIIINTFLNEKNTLNVMDYVEILGAGIEGVIGKHNYKIGSESYVLSKSNKNESVKETRVYISKDGQEKGCFLIRNKYRDRISEVIRKLYPFKDLSVLSGDNDTEKERLTQLFFNEAELKFNQLPENKLNYISELQQHNKNVMMLGDGLNDAGALKQSNVGIVVAENVNNFTPASDGIMDAKLFNQLPELLSFSSSAKHIVYASFILSFVYNFVGLYFAVTGNLTPVFAAILMPLSSISVVLFTTFAVNYKAKRVFSNTN